MSIISIVTEYKMGDIVYLKTDEDQKRRMLCQIIMDMAGCVQWQLSSGNQKSWHFEEEFTNEKTLHF